MHNLKSILKDSQLLEDILKYTRMYLQKKLWRLNKPRLPEPALSVLPHPSIVFDSHYDHCDVTKEEQNGHRFTGNAIS